ncbi:LuxR C-terminal-related transcriptional regulator [Kitasatospora sp. NBC_01539]|uniref:helix-turn-helix transcriptional regulator n=1 Tax=Kitasatospora sp. NBC_01539 TaxID=2903577 RepID=UPI0038601D27
MNTDPPADGTPTAPPAATRPRRPAPDPQPAEATLRHLLERTLADPAAAPLLVLLEGEAGRGRSTLATRLCADLPVPARTRPDALGGPPPTGPLLLLAEDVHRAAAADADALRALLAAPPPGLACVLTYRPEELPEPGLPLGPATDYPAALTVVRHVLGPLTVADVRRRAAAALGPDHGPPGLAAHLHRAAGGNAQVVADLLGPATAASTAAALTAGTDPAPPPRLCALVLRRTAALSAGHRAVVHAAAVLDGPATAADLTGTAGLTPAEARTALLAALRTAALQDLGDGRYGFGVPLAAAALRAHLPGPDREDLHRRAARVLARRQPVPWERVAAHRLACGDLRGWLPAVEHAARRHIDDGGLERAVGLLESALATGPVPEHARSRLATLLARAAVMGLRSDRTVEVLRHIVADPGVAPAVRGEIRLDLGLLLCNQMGRCVEGLRELEHSVGELQGQPVLLARAMSALAMPYWPGGSLAENTAWIERAVTVAEQADDPVVRAAVAANRASVLLSTGDPGAWPLVDALPRESGLVAARQQAARGLCNAADAAVWLGHYERSRALLGEGVALAARSGASYAEHTGRACTLVLDWASGRWAGLAARAGALVDEAGAMPYIASDARMVLGLLALARGSWADTAVHLTGPDTIDLDGGPVPLSATISGALVRLALARDDLPAAAAEAATAWQRMRAKGVWAWAAELAPWAVEATARSGAVAAAREMTAEFAAGLEGRDAPSAEAALHWTRGALAEAVGDAAGAARHHGAAARLYAALPRPYHAALTGTAAARCTLAAGGPAEAAVAALAENARRFEALGATWDAACTRAELRGRRPAEERRTPGRPGYGDLLSPRETEVAQLAAGGMTNREIAAALHLSPRTVEQHVARAMQKTGAQSRQQLAPGPEAAD